MTIYRQIRPPQCVTASLLYLLALGGIGILAYGVHLTRAWQHGGDWCIQQVGPSASVRRYGNACIQRLKRALPRLEV
ncbi:MAG: hypothetical protein NZ772_13970 [Cyanobacteria bacterium]|nr:hypothetical protein [Cyanobacteriota bacterium]MDW8202486.1 hypothetical protein [Cyanobacteriota bacterium SKYGB_h_bin112]